MYFLLIDKTKVRGVFDGETQSWWHFGIQERGASFVFMVFTEHHSGVFSHSRFVVEWSCLPLKAIWQQGNPSGPVMPISNQLTNNVQEPRGVGGGSARQLG